MNPPDKEKGPRSTQRKLGGTSLGDRQRLMIIATHNTNNGDGWEREAEDEGYFREYSENRAYPLAINIIFYVMTH